MIKNATMQKHDVYEVYKILYLKIIISFIINNKVFNCKHNKIYNV
jgi:hypothetical protein